MSIKGGVRISLLVTLIDRSTKEILMPEVTFNELVRPEQHAYHNRFVLETMAEALAKISIYRKIAIAVASNPLYNNALSGKEWTLETKTISFEIIF